MCGICTEEGSDLPHDTCRRETLSAWHNLHLAQDTHPGNKQKVSLRQRGEVPSWLPGLGRYHRVLSNALTKQCSSFSSQISAILYTVPDVLSQLPSPTWFMFVILSIKKLVIKMKPSFPILLPAIALLHLPIPRPLLVFKRLISMWSCLCQDTPVPSAPFQDDQSHPDCCLPHLKIWHIF